MSDTIGDGSSKTVAVKNGVEVEEGTITATTTTTTTTSNTPAEDGNRPPRLPRWTRHEILVLIQGKKVAENRVRRGRTGAGSGSSSSAFGSNPLEPKWASVSSYCKRHGVNRGPVQCRKRWSNLAGDFKKIKEWEAQTVEETESFWVMRNDLRRERKLPGFFDREVYDILDGGVVAPLALAATGDVVEGDVKVTVTEEEEGRRVVGEDDGVELSGSGGGGGGQGESHRETSSKMVPPPHPMPISEKRFQVTYTDSAGQGPANETQAQTSNPDKQAFVRSSEDGSKRRRRASPSPDRGQSGGSGGNVAKDHQHINMHEHLVKVLEMNNRMLTAQLEAQNLNSQLDREQRTNHSNSLVAVISKLADSISKIADKL